MPPDKTLEWILGHSNRLWAVEEGPSCPLATQCHGIDFVAWFYDGCTLFSKAYICKSWSIYRKHILEWSHLDLLVFIYLFGYQIYAPPLSPESEAVCIKISLHFMPTETSLWKYSGFRSHWPKIFTLQCRCGLGFSWSYILTAMTFFPSLSLNLLLLRPVVHNYFQAQK